MHDHLVVLQTQGPRSAPQQQKVAWRAPNGRGCLKGRLIQQRLAGQHPASPSQMLPWRSSSIEAWSAVACGCTMLPLCMHWRMSRTKVSCSAGPGLQAERACCMLPGDMLMRAMLLLHAQVQPCPCSASARCK